MNSIVLAQSYIRPASRKRKHSEINEPVKQNHVNGKNECHNSDLTPLDEDILEKDIEEETLEEEPVREAKRKRIFYFMACMADKEEKKHLWVNLSKACPEEEEEVEVDVGGDDSDSDIEEVQIIETKYETIEIPDDDDDDDNVVKTEEKLTNGNLSPKISPDSKSILEKSGEVNGVNGIRNGVCSPSVPGSSTPLSMSPLVIKNPLSPSKVKNAVSPQVQKSVLIGGVVKKVLTSHDLKSGLVPMKSILSKAMVNGTGERKASLLKANHQQSVLKPLNPLSPQQSLLKPNAVNPRSSKIVIKPLNQLLERPQQQSLLKPSVSKITDLFKNNYGASTSKQSEAIKTGTSCLYCSKVFSDGSDLQIHIVTQHPHAELNESTNLYSVSAISELERELRDQSKDCRRCKTGFLYHIPNLKAHSKVHSYGYSSCGDCKASTLIIKGLINHLEEHAESIGEESDS